MEKKILHEFLDQQELHDMRIHVRQAYEFCEAHDAKLMFDQLFNLLKELAKDNVRLMMDMEKYQQDIRDMKTEFRKRVGGEW